MLKAIIAENLSKQYRIGHLRRHTMLRERLVQLFKDPFQRESSRQEVFWALKDVSFAVNQGDVLGIIGRNGAGKSTLLKIISKITYPTSGQITVRGRFASLLEVGTGFHDELTGRENVFLNGSILGMSRNQIRARLDAIVSFAEVEKFLDTPIKYYSTGMRLRLGFAVAAHLDADVLLVDEVLAVGDVGFQRKCLKVMGDLQSGGRTILLVSHNMEAVEKLCSHVLWLEGGRIHREGDAKEVLRAFMATFAGKLSPGSDLRNFHDRGGIGTIRYTKIEFLGPNRDVLPVIRSGEHLIIRLHYYAEKCISDLILGFRIYTDLGTLVADFSTFNTQTRIPDLPIGDGYVDLEIDSLNLMPARYSISFWLYNRSRVIFDALEHCINLDIRISDFYRTGRGIHRENGITFFPYKWHLDGIHDIEPLSVNRATGVTE